MTSSKCTFAVLAGVAGILWLAGCNGSSAKPRVSVDQDSPPATTPKKPALPDGPYQLCSTGLPTSGMWKCDPMLLDVNGDGYIDLAALPRLGIGPHIWFGDGEGRWKENSWKLSATQTSCGGGFDFGDINGDGHLDMAVADHCNGIFVYLGDGQGGWIPIAQGLFPEDLLPGAQKRQMFQGAEDLVLGDVNGDGFPDIVSGAADEGGINVYLGNGTGDNWKRQDQTSLPASRWTVRVELADVNGDGIKDLLASHSVGPRVWLSDGKGGWTAASDGLPSPMIEGLYGGLSTGDFNEDGRVDIAVANWVDGPEVYLQQADGSWRKMPDVFPDMQGGAVGLDTDDLNQDGHLDLVVSGRLTTEGGFVRGIFALLGDGKGGFRFWENSGLPSTGLAASTGVTIGDVNQDGVPDIALASGLIVETGTGRSEPIVPERMLVWCSSPNSGSK